MLLLFFVVSSRFLGGLGAVPRVFFISFLFPLLKREGRLETPTVAEHTQLDSIALISGKLHYFASSE